MTVYLTAQSLVIINKQFTVSLLHVLIYNALTCKEILAKLLSPVPDFLLCSFHPTFLQRGMDMLIDVRIYVLKHTIYFPL